jgi:hypothetical protein
MSDDGDGVWAVRAGGGLLYSQPISESLRAAHAKEDEKDRLQLEQAAEQRRAEAAERAGELAFRGVVPRSPQELFAEMVSPDVLARERAADRAAEKAEARAAEEAGRPRPTVNKLLRDAKEARLQREAEEAATPASVAELGKVAAQVKKLKHGVFAITGHKIPL